MIRDAAVAHPPGEVSPGSADDSWAVLTIVESTDPIANAKARWEAALVAGAFRDRSAAEELPPVDGYSIQVLANDVAVPMQITAIDGFAAHPGIRSVKEPDLRSRIAAGLAGSGMTMDAIEFLRPMGFGAIVDTKSDNPAAVLDKGTQLDELVGDLKNYDGVFLIIRSNDGQPAIVDWFADRSHTSFFWVDPGLGRTGDIVSPDGS